MEYYTERYKHLRASPSPTSFTSEDEFATLEREVQQGGFTGLDTQVAHIRQASPRVSPRLTHRGFPTGELVMPVPEPQVLETKNERKVAGEGSPLRTHKGPRAVEEEGRMPAWNGSTVVESSPKSDSKRSPHSPRTDPERI